MIDLDSHQIFAAVAGGLAIGLAALGMLYFLGRITGISGIAWGAIENLRAGGQGREAWWRVAFVGGLLLGPLLVHGLSGLAVPPEPTGGLGLAILGGLLVGVGTRLGSGCTSGHGVCGIARLSPRSIVATLTFMGAGIVAVYITRHMLGWPV